MAVNYCSASATHWSLGPGRGQSSNDGQRPGDGRVNTEQRERHKPDSSNPSPLSIAVTHPISAQLR